MRRVVFVTLGAIVLCLAYGLNFFGPVYPVPVGAAIRHDDFTFTVTSVSNRQIRTGLRVYEVQLRVANQAKRVPYAWNDRIAYVREGRGPRYYATTRHEISIAAGNAKNVTLRFELPGRVIHPALRFWDGVFMGDAFNAAAYAKAAVQLNEK